MAPTNSIKTTNSPIVIDGNALVAKATRETDRAGPRGESNTASTETLHQDTNHHPQSINTKLAATSGLLHGASPRPSALERLPPELFVMILSWLDDPTDLKAAARASPVLHEKYLISRRRLLFTALNGKLGRAIVDAWAVRTLSIQSAIRSQLNGHEAGESAKRFLQQYTILSKAPVRKVLELCSEEDLVEMTSFYLRVIQPTIKEVPELMFEYLDKPDEVDREPPSPTEAIRLARAMYRFDVYQSLFGRHTLDPHYISAAWVLSEFFGLFEPWEVEEIGCMNHYIRQELEHSGAIWDIMEQPEFTKLIDPDYVVWFRHEPLFRDPVCYRLAGEGLEAFSKRAEMTSPELVRAIREAPLRRGYPIRKLIDREIQTQRRRLFPSPRDDLEATREELPFSGDREDGPPLGWVLAFKGTYSNAFGWYIPDSLQDWGWVFWDARRFAREGGLKGYLEAHWSEYWEDDDPRDYTAEF